MHIGISTNSADLTEKAIAFAKKLNLPFTLSPDNFDYLLIVTPTHLELCKVGDKTKPLIIDFLAPTLTYRRKAASVKKEVLARALGLKSNLPATIVDATAGLGRDSFILAALGFNVILLERSPILSLLLQDALSRATQNKEVAPIIQRMQFIESDARTWLQNISTRPELIYLDPMFPERNKKALVKKEMRIFQDVIGNDDDGELLLKAALTCATKRVVVKRPRLADNLGGIVPSFTITGSSSRFDVYII